MRLHGATDAVDQVRQPFYLNVAAQAAAVEALKHQDEVERRVAATLAGRMELRLGCGGSVCGWRSPMPTSSGCASLRRPARGAIVDGLRERGVIVRAGGSLGRPGALRVTVGNDAENDRFLSALADVV